MTIHKFFNGRVYTLNKSKNRWGIRTYLHHDVWNFYNPNDPILRGDGYVIDHINKDSSDDRIENLRKMTLSEHTRMHSTGNQYNLGKHHSDETKQKMSDANLGKHRSDETKQKMSKAKLGKNHPMYGKHHTDETKQKMREALLGSKNPNWKGGKKK